MTGFFTLSAGELIGGQEVQQVSVEETLQPGVSAFLDSLETQSVAWSKARGERQRDTLPSQLFTDEFLARPGNERLATVFLDALAAAHKEGRAVHTIKEHGTRELADGTTVFAQGEHWFTFIRDEQDEGHGFLLKVSMEAVDAAGSKVAISDMQLERVHRATPSSEVEPGWPRALFAMDSEGLELLKEMEASYKKRMRAYKNEEGCVQSFAPHVSKLREQLPREHGAPGLFEILVTNVCDTFSSKQGRAILDMDASTMNVSLTTDRDAMLAELQEWALGGSARRRYNVLYGEEGSRGMRVTLTRPIHVPARGGSEAPRFDAVTIWTTDGRGVTNSLEIEIAASIFAANGVLYEE